MLLNIDELSEIIKKLPNKEGNKLSSHLFSLERKIEDLMKSRDMWKERALEKSKPKL